MTSKIISDIISSILRNISGSIGRKLRYYFYSMKLKECGVNVVIDEGVVIENPEFISIGNNVWIDKYTILLAGKEPITENIKIIQNHNYFLERGELKIGDGVHIGCFNIIQAHAGIYIENYVTTSAGVKIYSLSNYPFDEKNAEEVTYANCLVGQDKKIMYISSPIVIREGVWIALNCSILGGTIGPNSFVGSNSIVTQDLPPNSYAMGSPARIIKNRFKET